MRWSLKSNFDFLIFKYINKQGALITNPYLPQSSVQLFFYMGTFFFKLKNLTPTSYWENDLKAKNTSQPQRNVVNILKILGGGKWLVTWPGFMVFLLSSLLYVHTAHERLGSYSWYEWTRFKIHMTQWDPQKSMNSKNQYATE